MEDNSKNHHYVPRSLLRGFAADEEQTYVYALDKSTSWDFEVSIEKAGSETDFNTVILKGMRHNLEKPLFGKPDGKLATLLAKLRESKSLSALSGDERPHLAHLAAIQLLRVKQQRTTFVELTRQLRNMLENHGGPISEDILPRIDENYAKAMSLRMVAGAERFVPQILNKNWVLQTAPRSTPFWISDCPIVTVNIFPYGKPGLSSPGVEIAWPLASDLVLSFLCPSIAIKMAHDEPAFADLIGREPTFAAPLETVTFYNSLQVFQSLRFVYGPTRQFEVARLILKKNPEAKLNLSRIAMSKMGEWPSTDKLPAGRWLVLNGQRSHYCCRLESWDNAEGRIQVVIDPEWMREFAHALADGPHNEVRVIDDKRGGCGMRNVSVFPHEVEQRRATIRYTDDAMDALGRQIEKN